jgi:hypothetical protein
MLSANNGGKGAFHRGNRREGRGYERNEHLRKDAGVGIGDFYRVSHSDILNVYALAGPGVFS